jgi:hypothetical protein
MKFAILVLGIALGTNSWAAVEDIGKLIQETEHTQKELVHALKAMTQESSLTLTNTEPTTEVTVADVEIRLKETK